MSKATTGRLIVTGHDPQGRSVFVSDDYIVESKLDGGSVRSGFLWGRDGIPRYPDDGSLPEIEGITPAPGGCRFSTLTIEAGATNGYHRFITSAMGEMAEQDCPGFHRTPSLDFIVVMEGEIVLEVDDGERVLVRGDCAILNGVSHRWHNRATEAATIVAVMIGARDERC